MDREICKHVFRIQGAAGEPGQRDAAGFRCEPRTDLTYAAQHPGWLKCVET